jgi:hypothetical protein
MKSSISGFDWREAIGDRIAVLGPLLVALLIVAVAVTRWMRGVHATGTLFENVVALDRESNRLGRDQAEWETDGRAGTYQVLWQSLPDGEFGMRDVMAWLKGTAARHGLAVVIRLGPAESVGDVDRRIERLRLDLTLTAPPGMSGGVAEGGTRAWSDLVEELLAGGAPIQVLSASWAGRGKGLSKCELSTLIWVQPPG